MYRNAYYTPHPMMGNGNMLWAGFGFHVVMSLLFWVVVVWVIASVLKHRSRTTESESLEILKQRYAKGELTKKEFDDIKKDL